MKFSHVKDRLRKKDGALAKLQEFQSYRRRIEREFFYWVGLRYGMASVMDKSSEERERLEQCETAGDFVRFYMETADLGPTWSKMTMKDRWQYFRNEATPFYSDGSVRQEYDRNTFLERLRSFLDLDPGVIPNPLP